MRYITQLTPLGRRFRVAYTTSIGIVGAFSQEQLEEFRIYRQIRDLIPGIIRDGLRTTHSALTLTVEVHLTRILRQRSTGVDLLLDSIARGQDEKERINAPSRSQR